MTDAALGRVYTADWAMRYVPDLTTEEYLWHQLHDTVNDYQCAEINYEGLRCKPTGHRMTLEGFSADTVCWHMNCWCDSPVRKMVGRTQQEVLVKAITFFQTELGKLNHG